MKLHNFGWLLVSTLSAGVLVACNGGPNKTNIEVIQNMMDQPSIKAQDWVPAEGDKLQMLAPPAHTVARGRAPYAYADNPGEADKLVNPLAKDRSPEMLTAGKHHFEVFCSHCHGKSGGGDGPVAEKMAVKPRNLLAPDAKAYTDGRIFHAITAGRGLMRQHASQIPDEKVRWKIVNYVRSLQGQK